MHETGAEELARQVEVGEPRVPAETSGVVAPGHEHRHDRQGTTDADKGQPRSLLDTGGCVVLAVVGLNLGLLHGCLGVCQQLRWIHTMGPCPAYAGHQVAAVRLLGLREPVQDDSHQEQGQTR